MMNSISQIKTNLQRIPIKATSLKQVERWCNYEERCIYIKYNNISEKRFKQLISLYDFLRSKQIHTPVIFDFSIPNREILMEDLGEDTIAKKIGLESEKIISGVKVTLVNMSNILSEKDGIDLSIMNFLEIQKKLMFAFNAINISMLNDKFHLRDMLESLIQLADTVANLPKSLSHHDFRTHNLFFHNNNITLIDLDELCYAPIYYDLVSFLNDPNLVLPENKKVKIRQELVSAVDHDKYYGCSLFNNLYSLGAYITIFENMRKTKQIQNNQRYINPIIHELSSLAKVYVQDYKLQKFLYQVTKVIDYV